MVELILIASGSCQEHDEFQTISSVKGFDIICLYALRMRSLTQHKNLITIRTGLFAKVLHCVASLHIRYAMTTNKISTDIHGETNSMSMFVAASVNIQTFCAARITQQLQPWTKLEG